MLTNSIHYYITDTESLVEPDKAQKRAACVGSEAAQAMSLRLFLAPTPASKWKEAKCKTATCGAS